MLFCDSFPECIGLNPQTHSHPSGDSDYKNFTLKFYKSDDVFFFFFLLK